MPSLPKLPGGRSLRGEGTNLQSPDLPAQEELAVSVPLQGPWKVEVHFSLEVLGE